VGSDRIEAVSTERAETLRRREFLGRLSIALCAFGTVIVAIPFVGFLLAPFFERQPEEWRPVGAVGSFRVGATVEVVRGDGPVPAQRLRQDVLPTFMLEGTGRSKAAAVRIDEPWVSFAELLESEAESTHHVGSEVVDEHICLFSQPLHNLPPRRVLQINCQSAFVAVQCQKDGIFALTVKHLLTGQIARAWALYLDNVSPEIAQHLRTHRAHFHLREIQNTNAIQWLNHLCPPAGAPVSAPSTPVSVFQRRPWVPRVCPRQPPSAACRRSAD